MIFLSVNYHYIDDETKYTRGIYPVSPLRLRSQLQELKKIFTFISQQDLLDALEGKKPLPEYSCLITFDDALRCQYEKALPILDEMAVPALFFVNSAPLLEKCPLFVHQIHWCRALLSPEEFLEKFKEYYKKLSGQSLDLTTLNMTSEMIKGYYPYDTPSEGYLKYLLTRPTIERKLRENIISAIFGNLVKDSAEFCKNFYLTEGQIKELHKRFSLGLHTATHQPLSSLSGEDLKREIGGNLKDLLKIVGASSGICSISYPYGTSDSVSRKVLDEVKKTGLRLGFTMEQVFNDSLEQPLLFSRLDANDVPGGKYPFFKINNNRLEIINEKLKRHRIF